MIPQNKNLRQLVWHLWYRDTAVEGNQLYCYNTEDDRNSVISQASCRMDVTRLEQRDVGLPQAHCGILQHFSLAVGLFLCRQAVLVESYPFCTTFDLQLNFYRPLCYNSRDQCPLLQCLRTSATLAGTHSNFVVSFYKCERKSSCNDLNPNPRIHKIAQSHSSIFYINQNYSCPSKREIRIRILRFCSVEQVNLQTFFSRSLNIKYPNCRVLKKSVAYSSQYNHSI